METSDKIGNDLVVSFSNIPYEILLGNIFPYLSIKTINDLCSVNNIFNDLCNDETLWKIKTSNEYPTLLNQKPITSTWRNYYRTLVSRIAPVYYHGDVISIIRFIPDEIGSVIESLAKIIYSLENPIIQIAFINSNIKLVIGVQYPDMIIKNFNPENKEITKIILINGKRLDLSEPLLPRVSRGRKHLNIKPKRITVQEQNNDLEIYKELISPLGNPPIYGYYKSSGYGSYIISNATSNVDTTNLVLAVIDYNDITDQDHRIIKRGKLCSILSQEYIKSLLLRLDPNFDTSLHYTRELLCEMLGTALDKIGHIL